MLLPQILALTLALVPSLASAAIFPKDSLVKMLDTKSFKKVMKRNDTSLVAFVAPWCGHCKNLAPEYSKAAVGLSPMVPLYAVDCDEESNKRLCADQGVSGFPTIKLFPRGSRKPSVPYNEARTAGALFSWTSKNVPDVIKRLSKPEDITSWAEKKPEKPRAFLLSKDKNVPLLWKALGNRYSHKMEFASTHDAKGKILKTLGLTVDEQKKGAKVVIYAADSTNPVLYDGPNKFEPLAKFLRSVLDGTADLTPPVKEEAKVEEEVAPDAAEAAKENVATPANEDEQVVLESDEPEHPKDEL